jgi:hypothetical protein
MTVEISKDKSKIEAEVMKTIKSGFATLATQNSWVKMTEWKKPKDDWYNLAEDGAMIEIKAIHNAKPKHHYLVTFEAVPKNGRSPLMINVGTLPFKQPSGT